MKIELVETKNIVPNARNRNKHSEEQIDRLCEIIKYQGFRAPLVVSNRSQTLVAGHGRLLAAKKLKLTHVPVIYQDFDSEEQEYAAGVSDNAIASWAELDLAGINLDLPDLGPELDVNMLGIKDFVLEPADKYESNEQNKPSMQDKFLVPPFSVLDARQGYWQDRKRQWLSLGIKSELGRGGGAT